MKEEVNKLIFNQINREVPFMQYDASYLVTTENISGYAKGLKDLDILTVCSSGDHFLNMVLEEPKSIDVFDINFLTSMVLELKVAAVKALDKEEFMTYFGIKNRKINNKKCILSYDLYKKIRTYLNDEALMYFDYIYDVCNKNNEFIVSSTSLFYGNYSSTESIIGNNTYLQDSNYELLKFILSLDNYKPKFIWSNIYELDEKVNKKYDRIFLSNIQDYQNIDIYMQKIYKLTDLLENNGLIYFAYLYYNTSKFYVYKKVLKENEKCYSIKVTPAIDFVRSNAEAYDKILVLHK